MSKTNVGVLTTSFPRFAGDNAGNFVYGLTRSEVSQGITIEVIAPHDPRHHTLDEEMIEGFRLHRFHYIWPQCLERLCYGYGIPANLRKHPWLAVEIPALLVAFTRQALGLARRCEVLHAHWTLAGLAAGLAGSLTGTPVVITMHGAEVFVRRGVLKSFFVQSVLNMADHIIANSHFTKSRIKCMSDFEPITVIPFGVDTDRFGSNKRVENSSLELPTYRPLVFALGRLVERKGFHHLIRAMPRIKQETNAYLVIGGDGPQRQHLEQLVDNLDLRSDILLAGFIDGEVLPNLYAAADVFVLPSIEDRDGDTEGLGIVLLEAMASGTAVVASKVGGISDIVKDGSNGFLIEQVGTRDLADRTSQLILDNELRRSFGEKGRLFVEEHFSWQTIAQKHIEVYEQVMR
jgi:glycosyltransferase involved in cell wall biosynthesis